MITRSSLLSCLIIAVLSSASQNVQAASAKDVVEQFVKLDVEGARLMPQGWNQASLLFTRQADPSQPSLLVVIAKRYGVSQDTTKENYFVLGYDDIGHIDPSTLLFTPTHVPMVMWWYKGYRVELTKSGWRIEGAQPSEMHVGADAAMRWVKEVRDRTADPAIQRNANQTLVRPKPYR